MVLLVVFSQEEIYPGSKIKITESQAIDAKAKCTPTALAITLVVALFPLETLLVSNLRGGKSKVRRVEQEEDDSNSTSLKALDSVITNEILGNFFIFLSMLKLHVIYF